MIEQQNHEIYSREGEQPEAILLQYPFWRENDNVVTMQLEPPATQSEMLTG